MTGRCVPNRCMTGPWVTDPPASNCRTRAAFCSDELLPLLPPERHRELRLVATAIAIAGREATAGGAGARYHMANAGVL